VEYLLDTHALLYLLGNPSKISPRIREELETSPVYISAASLWEIAIKSRLGKLKIPADFFEQLDELQFDELAITSDHTRELMNIEPIHNDPFDRMLISQARCEQLTLVTNDPQIAKYSRIQVVW
jgi:PIN domain nuclease of toxin-antitoxin system